MLMKIFVNLSSSLKSLNSLKGLKIFTISSDKLDSKTNIGKIFWRHFSLAHFPLALQN